MKTRLVDFAAHYWGEYLGKIATAIEPLSEAEVWWRPNSASNSIGNLLVHLDGNLRQWVISGLGGEPYERHRDAEFAATGGIAKRELLARLRTTVTACQATLGRLKPAELARRHTIQQYDIEGYRALFHTVEHMSYHTGQIVLLAKMQGAALDFYPQHRGE